MQKTSKRVLALVLSLIMALSVFSISASAASNYRSDYQSETHTVYKHTEQTLAPGVEYYNNYAYSSDGKQMVYYVTTAEVNRDDVVVQVSYKDMQCDTYGMSKLSEQVDAANAKFTDPSNPEFISENYAVVSATNGDGYNMTTGEPGGCLVMNGKIKKEWTKNTSSEMFFAILKDGRAVISDSVDEWNAYKADPGIKEAIDSFGTSAKLVWDGVDVTANASGDYNTDRHSRTMFGVTADGKVVQAVLDGRQEPFSCGGSMHELAQIMIEAGCERAFNCDGGGSTTFMARTLGDETAKVVNRPSDGSPRSISNGLIIATTTPPSDRFDRVSISAADEYITPGTATELTFAGVSPAGTTAEIPAEVTYEATLGSVVDGQFISDGTAGDAVISAKYNGQTVGTATVHVVIPDAIDITSDSVTIPYGKSADIPLVAKYGLNEVAYKTSDFTITVNDAAAGTIDGLTFTAADESEIASTTIVVALKGTDLSDSATLLFGKGSDVIFDFEDGTTNGFNLSYSNYNYYLPNSKAFVATKENGKVHSGNYALGLNIDYSNSQESGYQMTALYQGKVSGNANYYEGAQKLGTWIYIPDEYVGLWVRWTISPISAINEDGSYTLGSITHQTMDRGAGGTGVVYSFDESGWHYLWADLSAYKGVAWRDFYYCMQFYISDRDGASYGYYAKNNHNINGDFTVYLDDITVDYSSVVEDRDAPVFGSVKVSDEGPHSNEAYAIDNSYVSEGYSSLGFSADVNEYSATNASGINAASAQAYIDGNPVDTSYSTGKIFTNGEYNFAEGKHTIKFVIYDNAGNRASATRTFTVTNVSKAESIKVVPHDASLDRILHGSLYWVDVVAAQAEKVDSVTTTLNLDSMSKWELDHMTVADGFEASYKIVDAGDKIAEITIDNNGSNLAGEQALVSIPIRAWYLDNTVKKSPLNGSTKAWTYAEFKASKEFWPVATEVRVQQGAVTYTDGSSDYFTGDDVFVWSESWANYANMTATTEGKAYFNAWDGGHLHSDTPEIINQEDASCTEAGYSGDKFCDECNSIIEWGKVVPATGHSFAIDEEDGLMKCSVCGELANEEIDGKQYADGAVLEGFVDDKYYIDGIAQDYDGVVEIEDIYYEFDNGTVIDKYTGLFFDEEDGVYRYSQLGTLASGWKQIDGDWHYFRESTLAAAKGTYNMNWSFNRDIVYDFADNGKVLNGIWSEDENGTRYYYGPTYYRCSSTTSDATLIEIEGETYAFDHNGYIYTGVHSYRESNADRIWYDFGEDGKLIGTATGMFTENGVTFYVVDGQGVYAGLIEIDGDYYYIRSNYHVATGHYYVAKTNDLLPEGYYDFADDGKMIISEPENGIVDGYYYVDGVPTYAGLIKIDNDYYYAKTGGQIVTGRYYISKTNGLLPNAWYDFDETGKMTTDVSKNGIVDGYYYVDGVKAYAGLIEIDGDYYYIRSNGAVATGKYWVSKPNGLMTEGYYNFGDDGKMIIPEEKNGIVDGYYYVDGVATYAGLIKIGDDYYYAKTGGQIVTGTYYISKTNGIVPAAQYEFDAEGKLTTDIEKNGIVDGYYYVYGIKNYAGLIEIDGDYYYIRSNGAVATGKYWVSKPNGLVTEGYYNFGNDGKMIQD